MQASSCTQTQLNMFVKRNSSTSSRNLGTNDKSIKSCQANWASIKRKKFDTTDWPEIRPIVQGGKLSDTCVFTWATPNHSIPDIVGIDQINHLRASNHRYGARPLVTSRRKHLVPRRLVGALYRAGFSSSGWTLHADDYWWVQAWRIFNCDGAVCRKLSGCQKQWFENEINHDITLKNSHQHLRRKNKKHLSTWFEPEWVMKNCLSWIQCS